MDSLQRRLNNIPIFEGPNLEAFVEEALKDTQKPSVVKRSPSPWKDAENKRDSGIDDSISVNITSESSESSAEISPSNGNSNVEKHPKTEDEKNQKPNSTVKVAQKLPKISTEKPWNARSSSKDKTYLKENNNSKPVESKMLNNNLPPRPPTTTQNERPNSTMTRSNSKTSEKSVNTTTQNPTTLSITARNQALAKVRTLRANLPTSRPKLDSKSSIPDRPSLVRANNSKKPPEYPVTSPTTKKPPEYPITSPTTKKPPPFSSPLRKSTETPIQRKLPETSRNPTVKPKPLSKIPSSQNESSPSSPKSLPSSPKAFGVPASPTRTSLVRQSLRNSFRSSLNSNGVSGSKKPLTASERRNLEMKPSDSVSTASRPMMIRTGSVSERPRWI